MIIRSLAVWGRSWQESHAIAGRTARCRCKFQYISNFTTGISYVRFPYHSMAFLS